MATTSQYLTSLQNDMATLKTNVQAKGVEVTESDNFTSLASKVAQIPSGSSDPTIESISDMTDYINSCFDKIDEVLNKQVSNRTAYTNNALTLYTPNSECQNYVISQRTESAYRVIWFQRPYITNYQTGIMFCGQGTINESTTRGAKFSTCTLGLTLSDVGYSGICYTSQNYNNVQECIDAIQNNSTTYSQLNNVWLGAINNSIIYSNVPAIINETGSLNINAIQKLSKNETIVTI